MKRIRISAASSLLLALGIAGPVVARQEKPDKQQEEKAKPQKQEEKGKAQKQEQPAKPERQQPEKSAKQEQPQAKNQQTQEQKQQKPEKGAKQEQPQARSQQTQEQKQQQDNSAKQQARAGKQEQQAKPEKQQEAKTQQQAGERQQQGGSSHPPERTQEAKARQQSHQELRLSARGSGRIPEERFHSNFGREHNFRMQEPVLVGGYSRFQYGGYWFGFVEPWPAGWYYTDDVYIDYVDGEYYMYDPYYPGTRFAISVVL
jgi:hypothetical protein